MGENLSEKARPLSSLPAPEQKLLQSVTFVPGQEVKKGVVLFQIDSRPLQAALSQAEANLLKAMAQVRQGQDIVAKDQAAADNDRVIAKRDANLLEAGV